MAKIALSYLAGGLTVAIAVFLNAPHTSMITFVLGVLTVLIVAGASLSSAARIRRAARFLNAFASGLESRRPAVAEMHHRTPAQELRARRADMTSHLSNFGSGRRSTRPSGILEARQLADLLNPEEPAAPSKLEEEISSALVNIGSKRKTAELAAKAAVEQVGAGASFQDAFQAAVSIARTAKAA